MKKSKSQKCFGTDGFISPEKLNTNDYDLFKADIFSLGAILFYLAFGKQGFLEPNSDDSLYSLIMENTNKSKEN